MALNTANLQLSDAGTPGHATYFYRTTDTMATVIAAAYFDYGPNAGPRFQANDLVFCLCSDGNMWVKIYSASDSTGICVTQYAGGDLPIQTWATGTAAGDFGLSVGYYEVSSATAESYATGSRAVLPVPYPGAEVLVRKVGSGTLAKEFYAGASDSGTNAGNWVVGMNTYGGATSITFDGTNRIISLVREADYFHVVGTSNTRWRILAQEISASAISENASVWLVGS